MRLTIWALNSSTLTLRDELSLENPVNTMNETVHTRRYASKYSFLTIPKLSSQYLALEYDNARFDFFEDDLRVSLVVAVGRERKGQTVDRTPGLPQHTRDALPLSYPAGLSRNHQLQQWLPNDCPKMIDPMSSDSTVYVVPAASPQTQKRWRGPNVTQ